MQKKTLDSLFKFQVKKKIFSGWTKWFKRTCMPTQNTQWFLSFWLSVVNTELEHRHSSNNKTFAKATTRQWTLSNLVSGELERVSKWVSAAEAVLRVKAVRQGRQRGFLKGNRRCTEGTRNEFKTTQPQDQSHSWFRELPMRNQSLPE